MNPESQQLGQEIKRLGFPLNSNLTANPLSVISRLVPLALTVYLVWLLMMLLHKTGHILHAWTSGGTVVKFVLHPLAISRTDVDPNPNPMWVVWGGMIWASHFAGQKTIVPFLFSDRIFLYCKRGLLIGRCVCPPR